MVHECPGLGVSLAGGGVPGGQWWQGSARQFKYSENASDQ